MVALRIGEIVMVLFLLWFWFTQVLMPVVYKLPLFPAFHRRWRSVEHDLNEVTEDEEYLRWKAQVLQHKHRMPGVCEICGEDTGSATLLRCPAHLQKGHES